MRAAAQLTVTEETLHPRDWSEEIIQEEISGPYAEHASDPGFSRWLKKSLTEAIERSLPDDRQPIPLMLRCSQRHSVRTNIKTSENSVSQLPSAG